MNNTVEIVKKETEVITYSVKDGILNMIVKPAVLTEENLKESLSILPDYIQEGKILVLLDPTNGIAPNKEQRKQIIEAFNDVAIAKAVINKNLLTPFVVNIMMKFEKISFPMKMFKSEENALKWLNSYKIK